MEFVYENKEVLAGWDEAKADLVGDLAAVDAHEITIHMNPKLMRSTDEKRTDEEDVHIQINASTQIFTRHISSDKDTVITKYEEATGSDISSLLKTGNNAPSVMVWLSNEDKQVAEAVLISTLKE
ncbi:hypothetical protein D1872_304840 [compost metagenome]